jgi:hypothetical protein
MVLSVEQWVTSVDVIYQRHMLPSSQVQSKMSPATAEHRRLSALNDWHNLTDMEIPPIVVSTHDLLRRSLIYEADAMNAYLGNASEARARFDSQFVDSRDEFTDRRDLILALCGINQVVILEKIQRGHALEDLTQRMLLTDDPEEAESLRHEANIIIDPSYTHPEADRMPAIQLVKSIAGDAANVEYLFTIPGVASMEETYAVGATYYAIDPDTNTLVALNELPSPDSGSAWRVLDFTPLYTQDQLKDIAHEFVRKYAQSVDLSGMKFTSKFNGDEYKPLYWFKWEDLNAAYSKIQIALTPAGDIASYLNTMPSP